MMILNRIFCHTCQQINKGRSLIIFKSLTLPVYKRSVHLQVIDYSKKSLPAEWGSKLHKGKRNLQLQIATLDFSAEDERELLPLRDKVKQQGEKVRKLKEEKVSEMKVKAEVLILKERKKELENMILKLSPSLSFDRARMNDLIRRRFYFDNSFDIYGGISGQFDFGPMGSNIIENIIKEWQHHFIIQEQMLKVNCSILTPEKVLKASGHTARFSDAMVKDTKTGECFRLDHLIKMNLEENISKKSYSKQDKEKMSLLLKQLENMTLEEMELILKEYKVKSHVTGNDLSEASTFNLMFPVNIGPKGHIQAYLRPETSQGIFVNFKNLLKFNQERLPFACAQVGNAYRNEISPESGLLRVREFTMAEIAHFCFPDDKSHRKFDQVSNEKLLLYSACHQMEGKFAQEMSIKEAVNQNLIANETLGYYLAKIQQFLIKIGVDRKRVRFRQHLNNEMAHYATDCWDAECLTSYGWIECVGCADRSAYDLIQHSQATGISLTAKRTLLEPKELETPELILNLSAISKKYAEEVEAVVNNLNSLKTKDIYELEENLKTHGKYELNNYIITKRMISEIRKTTNIEKIVPSVIEPSFGIGRILYTLLEHTFRVRENDEKRTYFSLPINVSPVKVSIFPLSGQQEFDPIVNKLVQDIANLNIEVRLEDTAGSIGKRYTRTDEIAVPFGITVDFDTLNKSPQTVTIRERDSMDQIRVLLSKVPSIIDQLVRNEVEWSQMISTYGKFSGQETKNLQDEPPF